MSLIDPTIEIFPLVPGCTPNFGSRVWMYRADSRRWCYKLFDDNIRPYVGNSSLAWTHWAFAKIPASPT